MPRECGIRVLGFGADGAPVDVGLLTESDAQTPIYVKGDNVKVVPVRKGALQVDPAADSKEALEPEGGNAELVSPSMCVATPVDTVLGAPAPAAVGLLDNDAMPDTDAKLERLPSNTPVLRSGGEAAGVERRWLSANRAGEADDMGFPGASYVSNAATVEVGDSDAESKDGSSNNSPSNSSGERATWSRLATLDNMIATALPILSAVSSENSEAPNRWTGSGLRELADIVAATDIGGMGASGVGTDGHSSAGGGRGRGSASRAATEGEGQEGNSNDLTGEDMRNERGSASSLRRRACAGSTVATEDALKGKEGGRKKSPAWKWAVKVRVAAMPRKARLRLYLEQRLSLASPGPSLEKAREWMKAWTPEMDRSLLELLGAVGTRAVSQLYPGGSALDSCICTHIT